MNYLKSYQEKFDRSFYTYVDEKIHKAKVLDPHACDLLQLIKTFSLHGGKRFRPALFYYAYESSNKESAVDPLRFSFVFELFHVFALVHDDIIDNADLRRGKQTVNKEKGVEIAILVGDLALTLADEIFFDVINAIDPFEKRDELIKLYSRYKQELIEGQYLDFIHISDIQKIICLKTSLYSFVRPVLFGFLLGGKQKKETTYWMHVLDKLGVVFQTKDDWSGIFDDEKHIGKPILSDVKEGKNTQIIQLFKQNASIGEMKKFELFFGKKSINQSDLLWFKNLLLKKEIDNQIRDNIEKSLTKIEETLTNSDDLTSLLKELISLVRVFPTRKV